MAGKQNFWNAQVWFYNNKKDVLGEDDVRHVVRALCEKIHPGCIDAAAVEVDGDWYIKVDLDGGNWSYYEHEIDYVVHHGEIDILGREYDSTYQLLGSEFDFGDDWEFDVTEDNFEEPWDIDYTEDYDYE